jgi:hypothetical protein
MILNNIFAKNLGEEIGVFTQNTDSLCKTTDHNIGF